MIQTEVFDDEPTNPCGCLCTHCPEEPEKVVADLPHSPSGAALNSLAPVEGSSPKILAFTEEIGSNEDEWEVETLPEISWNELGGEQ